MQAKTNIEVIRQFLPVQLRWHRKRDLLACVSIKRVLDFQNTGESQLAGISRQFCIRQASTSCHDDNKDTPRRIGCSAPNRLDFVGFGPRIQAVILRVESKRGVKCSGPFWRQLYSWFSTSQCEIARVRLVRGTVYEFQRALRYRKGDS